MASEPPPLDPVLLRSFLKVSETRSFTEAARQLGLQQSSVSQHVARLEKRVGRRLLARDTHEVRTTPDGDAILPLARQVLEASTRIERYLKGSTLRGRLRLGVSEDFAFTVLPDILAEFAMQHHAVDLELTVGLSGLLYERYDAGDLDLIFVKRRKGDDRGGSGVRARFWPSSRWCPWCSIRRPALRASMRSTRWNAPVAPGGSPAPATAWRACGRRRSPASASPPIQHACCRPVSSKSNRKTRCQPWVQSNSWWWVVNPIRKRHARWRQAFCRTRAACWWPQHGDQPLHLKIFSREKFEGSIAISEHRDRRGCSRSVSLLSTNRKPTICTVMPYRAQRYRSFGDRRPWHKYRAWVRC